MRRVHKGFTFIELIIVIVILGIIGKFGVEILMQAYENYIYSVSNNRLLAQSEAGVQQIANRLQYRIKESVIVRNGSTGTPNSLATSTMAGDNVVLEWIGYDIDGWQGDAATTPTWSGVIDVDNPLATNILLISPGTDTGRANTVINSLSPRNLGLNGSAIFFIGDEGVSVNNGFGWNGAVVGQTGNMHSVNAGGNINEFVPAAGNFSNVDVYEFYRLAWTAYAIEMFPDPLPTNPQRRSLRLWYDYRPWLGETMAQGRNSILTQDVDTFRVRAVGDVIKVQLCITNGDIFNDGGYSVCKEKSIL